MLQSLWECGGCSAGCTVQRGPSRYVSLKESRVFVGCVVWICTPEVEILEGAILDIRPTVIMLGVRCNVGYSRARLLAGGKLAWNDFIKAPIF